MGHGRDYLDGLVRLGRATDDAERVSVWRQSMATLAADIASRRPVPLEGYSPSALLDATQAALAAGLVDDMSFLSPPAAAVALYELASALPTSDEKRELGRRVLERLHGGNAPTFVALATRLALTSRRALSGASIRARVALSLDLPIGVGARADALALALVSRRDGEREWLTAPSSGALPARRLAARLLERAAREAARRAVEGDDSGTRMFALDSIRAAWERLLADRESLVWRHVATARGLLSQVVPAYAEEIDKDLDPALTPTEWRRAAASLTARIAVRPEDALRRARAFLAGPVPARDPGVRGAMVLGMTRAVEAEPEAVEELLVDLVRGAHVDALEALVDLRRERLGHEVGRAASALAQRELETALNHPGTIDEGQQALMAALHTELRAEEEGESTTLPELMTAALVAFATGGAEAAHQRAQELLSAAQGALGTLLLTRDRDGAGRRHIFRSLRELDIALLEKATLGRLLMLGPSTDRHTHEALNTLFDQLADWLIRHERDPIAPGVTIAHTTFRLRRMRTLLHLVDADRGETDEASQSLRKRRTTSARFLLRRAHLDAPSPLRRVVCAAASRACDALVRDDICEVSDILICATTSLALEDLQAFAEASMVPDVEAGILAYTALEETLTAVEQNGPDRRGISERACLDGLLRFAHELPVASSARVEALRASILGLVRALDAVAAAGSLSELTEGREALLLGPLETAVQTLAQLVAGALRRLGPRSPPESTGSADAIRALGLAVERAIRGVERSLDTAIGQVAETLHRELPPLVGRVVLVSLDRLRTLPIDAPRRARLSFTSVKAAEAPLPTWLPPNRVLGGFYVTRALGSGAVGSVFVARRAEQRRNDGADSFALKVPEYDGAAARTLSEGEFLEMFRSEAGALLALPGHPNLARFVTFDAGVRPKPILVMELVEGPSLERVIEMGNLDMTRALDILDGVAAGLEAMHRVGVGHLDVKPSNVILRQGDAETDARDIGQPVLVDFGLAGRHVRPGCATGEYGAPEVWGALGQGTVAEPASADVYSFGCLAYEVLTGQTLFRAPSEMALIAAHIAHDGEPEGVAALAGSAPTAPVAAFLGQALRRQPQQRATMARLREQLHALRGHIQTQVWPVSEIDEAPLPLQVRRS